jgi:hypothetical protein
MSAEDHAWLPRIGSGAAVLGAVCAGVGDLLHPITPREDPPGVARVIADSDLWTLIHLVIVVGIILMLAGLFNLSFAGIPVRAGRCCRGACRYLPAMARMGGVLRRDRIDPRRPPPGPHRQADGGLADPDHHRPDRDRIVDAGDRSAAEAPIRHRARTPAQGGDSGVHSRLTCWSRSGLTGRSARLGSGRPIQFDAILHFNQSHPAACWLLGEAVMTTCPRSGQIWRMWTAASQPCAYPRRWAARTRRVRAGVMANLLSGSRRSPTELPAG